jgi:hypothetical protein
MKMDTNMKQKSQISNPALYKGRHRHAAAADRPQLRTMRCRHPAATVSPLSPLLPARGFSTGILPFRHGDSNIERPPPGSSTSRGGMNEYYRKRLFVLCNGKE